MWGSGVPGRASGKCKGPKSGTSLAGFEEPLVSGLLRANESGWRGEERNRQGQMVQGLQAKGRRSLGFVPSVMGGPWKVLRRGKRHNLTGFQDTLLVAIWM